MGLDQFAYAVTEGGAKDGEEESLADWRKHNRLHGWMEELWGGKGRPNFESADPQPMGDFNCQPVELTKIDINALEEDIVDKTMPGTGGFFFGDDSFDWEDESGNDFEGNNYYYKEKDLEFISLARKALEEGKKVFYDSWW